MIPIKSIRFIDNHHDEDSYMIRYYDDKGNEVFVDNYTKKATRDAVKKVIFDSNGSIKVDMVFRRINGKSRVEIMQKSVEL